MLLLCVWSFEHSYGYAIQPLTLEMRGNAALCSKLVVYRTTAGNGDVASIYLPGKCISCGSPSGFNTKRAGVTSGGVTHALFELKSQ